MLYILRITDTLWANRLGYILYIRDPLLEEEEEEKKSNAIFFNSSFRVPTSLTNAKLSSERVREMLCLFHHSSGITWANGVHSKKETSTVENIHIFKRNKKWLKYVHMQIQILYYEKYFRIRKTHITIQLFPGIISVMNNEFNTNPIQYILYSI